jgi:hypothetical protein
LLKRLAEAVDGNRTGKPVYVVARYDSLSPVAGVFEERRDAEALARRLGSMHAVFGPYKHDALGPLGDGNAFFAGCRHDGKRSDWIGYCPGFKLPWESIENISLTIRLRDGTTRTMDLGRTTDAVFLSLAAIDKFAIPYYASILGETAAASMRADIVARAASATTVPPPP